jgi:murein L,D-transpeptidase YcbB/YkuD
VVALLLGSGGAGASQTDGYAAAAQVAPRPGSNAPAHLLKSAFGGPAEALRRPPAEAPVPFEQNAADPLAMDVLVDPSRDADFGLTVLDPADWRPEHDLRSVLVPPNPARDPQPERADKSTDGKSGEGKRPDSKSAGAKSVDMKSLDPEPDAAIKPPTNAAPSHDPLDRRKPALPALGPALGNAVPAEATAPAGQAEVPLPPLNAAIKTALDRREAAGGRRTAEQRKEQEAVAFYYAAHGFAPAWSEDGRAIAAVEPVLARLARASEDALTLTAAPAALKTEGKAEDLAESDLALTDAVAAYARQATGSRVDPRAISPLIGAKPDLADPAEVIDVLVAAGATAGDKLQALNPSEPRYVALREKLAEMHAARMPSVDANIPPGPVLRIGMRDPRVPLIRARFSLGPNAEGDADDLKYDTEVAAAVADFQRANGLTPSGVLNKRTIAALSGGQPSRLEAAIVANMEMWRWMPHDLGQDRIEVNVPEFTVTVFHAGQSVASNRVVVGKTNTPTPLFSNTMKYLIVNPVWNVPESIIKKEFIPKSGGDPAYLSAHGFDVSYRNGQLVVKQPSGAKNALGRIKFMFPNDYSVYLHDTPSKSLFAASKRAFSHGCVRVDQPFSFAESVLNDGVPEGGKIVWSQKRLQKMLGDKERYVNLPEPLPIHIEYFTAGVDTGTGELKLHDDVYDYARRVAAALGQAG